MKYKSLMSGRPGMEMIKRRITNLILMIHCQIISQRQDESPSDGVFHNSVSQILSGTAALGSSGLDKLITLIKSLRSIESKAECFRECNASLAKDLRKQSVPTQIVVTFHCLVKIYSRLDLQVLHYVTFLKKYLKDRWLSHAPQVCSEMILQGMVLFFKYKLKTALHLEIGHVCSEVMHLINNASESHSAYEVNITLRSLLFDKTPSFRHAVIDFFKRHNLYSDRELPRLVLDELVSSLQPLLVIDHLRKLQHNEAHWWTALGKFGNQKAIVCFYKPSVQDHREKDCLRFKQHSDTMHLNQISKLKNLKHPMIITLLAYQSSSMPFFYILEDYSTQNFQMALKNRNDNRGYFSLSILNKCLSDAAEAVEFCHKTKIVHANLTAGSLFIVGDTGQVKIGGFQLSVRLDGHKEKIVDDVCTEVPTRWTAPESLRRHKFSTASDVWMFGHLMYEVLTHGVLPYSHVDLTDEELVSKFFFDMTCMDPVQLFFETCLTRDHYELIKACTKIDPAERPNISTVLGKLQSFQRQGIDKRPQYPNLTDGKRIPSTSMRKGIPDVIVKPWSQNVEFVKEIRSMLTQYKMNEAFIFREIIEGGISEALLSRFNDGSMDDIIPWVQLTTSTANSRVSIIDCYIPVSCGLCLLDLIIDRHLGNSLYNYIEVLFHIAVFLKHLHDKGIVLGHMCASTFFSEQKFQKTKIYVASLGYASESAYYRRPPTDTEICQRAAPEVKSRGIYTTASDVFCFGRLIREVITAFDNFLTEEDPVYFNDSVTSSTLDLADCRYHLNQLIDSCGTVEVTRRPQMEHIVDEIRRLLSDLNSEYSSLFNVVPAPETDDSKHLGPANAAVQEEDLQSQTVPKQICEPCNDRVSMHECLCDEYQNHIYINNNVSNQSAEYTTAIDIVSNSCVQTERRNNCVFNTAGHGEDERLYMTIDSIQCVAAGISQQMATDSLTIQKQPISCVNVNLRNQPENLQILQQMATNGRENSQVLQNVLTNESEHNSAESQTLVKRTFGVKNADQQHSANVYDKLTPSDIGYVTFVYTALNDSNEIFV